MALVGNLKDIKLPTLVQINCMEKNSAKLTIEHMGRFGFIYFHDGQVVHAEYDPLIGEEAFFKLLELYSGNFKGFAAETLLSQQDRFVFFKVF